MIGNREIKRQRICHDFKTANFDSREFKWGYSTQKLDKFTLHFSINQSYRKRNTLSIVSIAY